MSEVRSDVTDSRGNASVPPRGLKPAARVWFAVGVVAVVAVLVNALALSATHLWVTPDASYYVELAGGIADHGDFRNELFLVRPYGYPLMLAAIFRVFGSSSPAAIQIIQHAMLVGVAVLTTLIAWHLTYRCIFALIAGLVTACSLQMLSYANQIMTEVPYALALTAAMYFLVTYHRSGGGKRLVAVSLCSAISYLIRPTGILVVPICLIVVIHRAWKGRPSGSAWNPSPFRTQRAASLKLGFHSINGWPSWWRHLARDVALAYAPAVAIVLPVMAYNTSVHGTDISGLTTGVALYQRLLTFDRFDSTESESLSEIREVVAEAKRRGAIAPHVDHTQWGPVWQAYEVVHGLTLAQSGKIMARAADDLIRENRGAFLDHTVRSAYWTLMRPDATYRFQPGGTPGWVTKGGECKREQSAAIFDIGTYRPMLGQWLDPYLHYLPLETSIRGTTSSWTGVANWFYRHVDQGAPFIGIGDTLYQEFVWVCLVGIGLSLFTRDRGAWMLIAGVLFMHLLVVAVLATPAPRYIVPLLPLLLPFGVLSVVLTVDRLVDGVRFLMRRRTQAEAVPAG